MYFPLFVSFLCWYLFCYALLCVHSSFAIILKRKRKLAVLLLLCYRCIVTINFPWLFLTVPWVGLQCLVVVFLDHIHFFIGKKVSLEYAPVLYDTKIGNLMYVEDLVLLSTYVRRLQQNIDMVNGFCSN